MVDPLMKVGRIEEETIVTDGEARALLADSALPHHCQDVAPGHGIDEDGPLLQRASFVSVQQWSLHQRKASGIPASGRIAGVHPSSRRARLESNGLSLVMKSSDAMLIAVLRPPVARANTLFTTVSATVASERGTVTRCTVCPS